VLTTACLDSHVASWPVCFMCEFCALPNTSQKC
jgi:hypothetical protein